MLSNIKRAIARIVARRVDGAQVSGTAFLVAERYLLTAFHVIGDRAKTLAAGSPVLHELESVSFEEAAVVALQPRLVRDCFDPIADWALLELRDAITSIAPVPLGSVEALELTELGKRSRALLFESWGYPSLTTKSAGSGGAIDGRIQDAEARYQGAYAYQLYSDNAAAALGDPLSGLSGAPCVVDGAAVGIIRAALVAQATEHVQPHNAAGVLYCCPIDTESLQKRCARWIRPIDPIRGLPGLPDTNPPFKPFQYLHWYGSEHASVFFGRSAKVRELYEMVSGEGRPALTLVYGASGVGKSSLLEAGLIPRLQWSFQVRASRRQVSKGLVEQLDEILVSCSLNSTDLTKPIVIVLDQVEEVFIDPALDGNREMTILASRIKAMTDSVSPRVRLVLGFRSEWLAPIRSRLDEHQLSRCEIHLERLGRSEVQEVVRGVASTRALRSYYAVHVDKQLPERIADELLSDPHSPVSTLLSIILTRLWEDAQDGTPPKHRLSADTYERQMRGQLTLRRFLEEQIRRVAAIRSHDEASGLVNRVLFDHTTADGTAGQVTLQAITDGYSHLNQGGGEAPYVVGLIDTLTRQYLLYDVGAAVVRGGPLPQPAAGRVTRLAHDTLAPIIRERFHASMSPGQRAERVLQTRTRDFDSERARETVLDRTDLTIVQSGKDGMRRWSSVEAELVAASQREKDRSDRRQRLYRRLAIAASTAIVALAIATLGLWLHSIALNERSSNLLVDARNRQANAFIDLGYLNLVRDPGASVNLALAAASLSPSARPTEVLSDALRNVPRWTVIAPSSGKTCKESSLTSSTRHNEPYVFATNEDLSRIVDTDGVSVLLKAVPSGETLARRQLSFGETSASPEGSSTNLLITRKEDASGHWPMFSVYGLRESEFKNPILQMRAREVALTGRGWPVVALLPDGHIEFLDESGNRRLVKGVWPDATAIHVHPSGRSVVLFLADRLVWLGLSVGVDAPTQRDLVWKDLPSTAEPKTFYGARSEFRWAGSPDRFFVMTKTDELPAPGTKPSDRPRDQGEVVKLYAVNGKLASRSKLLETIHPEVGLSHPWFESSSAGDVVAITVRDPNRDMRLALQLWYIDWTHEKEAGGAQGKAGPYLISNPLEERRIFPRSAAFSPNGQYLVASYNVNSHDFFGVGDLESWYLRDGTAPTAKRLSAGVVLGASLSDAAPGACPIAALYYSADSARLLALGDDQTAHIFRVRAEKPSEYSNTRMPADWERRLEPPSVDRDGPYNRLQTVRFGDGEMRLYDFSREITTNLSVLVGEPVIATRVIAQDRRTVVVVAHEIVSVRDGAIESRVPTLGRINSAQLEGDLLTLFGDDATYFYTIKLQYLGALVPNEAGT